MKLIVALGNPGNKYKSTRHNAGFDVAHVLQQRWAMPALTRKLLGSLVSDGRIVNDKCLVALPQSFMNRSGQPVASLMGYFKLNVSELIVIHDEMSLDFSVVRCKSGGGHGGHNGLRDIIKHIGPDFLRVRMGVGKPPPNWDTANYVLSKWTNDESKEIPSFMERGADAVESILRDGIDSAMNHFNTRIKLETKINPSNNQEF